MITDLMKDLVGKNIIVWGMSGRRYEGRLKESEHLDMILELKDGFIHLSLPCCEAIAWKKDLAEIAANAPELADYPELPGGWPRNYSKKPKSGEASCPKPEPYDERHFDEIKGNIIYIPVDVNNVLDIPKLASHIKDDLLAGIY